MPIKQWQMGLGDLLISIKSSRWLRALQALANGYWESFYCVRCKTDAFAQEQNSIGAPPRGCQARPLLYEFVCLFRPLSTMGKSA
jgi:hypothetical protein